jgi:hypothetical protein
VVRKYCGFDPAVDRLLEPEIAEMKRQGAESAAVCGVPS